LRSSTISTDSGPTLSPRSRRRPNNLNEESSMSTDTKELTVRRTVLVAASQARAFTVFTEGMTGWWPPSHHIGKADLAGGVIGPRAGGRWYECGVDGSECEWGRVLA